jgi:hypothetical protein
VSHHGTPVGCQLSAIGSQVNAVRCSAPACRSSPATGVFELEGDVAVLRPAQSRVLKDAARSAREAAPRGFQGAARRVSKRVWRMRWAPRASLQRCQPVSLDTNMLPRYFTRDDPAKAEKALALLRRKRIFPPRCVRRSRMSGHEDTSMKLLTALARVAYSVSQFLKMGQSYGDLEAQGGSEPSGPGCPNQRPLVRAEFWWMRA